MQSSAVWQRLYSEGATAFLLCYTTSGSQPQRENNRGNVCQWASLNSSKIIPQGCRECRSLFCYRSVQAAFSVFFFSFDRKFILEWNRNFIVTTVNRNCLLKYKIWGKKTFSVFFRRLLVISYLEPCVLQTWNYFLFNPWENKNECLYEKKNYSF